VHYGRDTIPGADEVVSGGIVKVQDLQRVFPSREEDPRILYLVSSSFPSHFRLKARVAQHYGGRVVLNQNGVAYPGWHGPGWERANRWMAWAHRHADYVIYQSDFCRRSAEKFLGPRPGAEEILHNPVDTSDFVPPSDRSGRDGGRLLMAGSHHFLYRVSTAVETLALLRKDFPDMRLAVAGRYLWRPTEEEGRREILDLAGRLGVAKSMDLHGAYSQAQAPGIMQAADILLHPKYNDPCPRLVVEAMACGLPVVYSATGGTPELVGEDGGIGVDGREDWEEVHPPDPEAMAAAVRRIMADYKGYASAARRRAVERFDLQPWLKRHGEIFRGLAP